MVQLDKKMIQYLTKLSRIRCTEEEQEALLRDLKKVLNYMDQLEEIDTTNVAPCSHVLEGVANVMRDDVAGEPMPRTDFLANVPSQVGGMVKVPEVIKGS